VKGKLKYKIYYQKTDWDGFDAKKYVMYLKVKLKSGVTPESAWTRFESSSKSEFKDFKLYLEL
jgi:hypothetical protein